MKKIFLSSVILLTVVITSAQTKTHPLSFSAGATVQHYNGNLGNSFFQFNTTCFGGGMLNIGYYLNRSFDLNLGGFIGDFGYCQTEADQNRVVAAELRCPGCTNQLGMGELRSRMLSMSMSAAFKFANGKLLSEHCRVAPYVYAGVGISNLRDNMQRNCVNAGNHFSVNSGLGVKYRISERVNIGYNLGISCFTSKKVYASAGIPEGDLAHDEDVIQIQKRKDLLLQNTIFIGISLF